MKRVSAKCNSQERIFLCPISYKQLST